MKKIILYLSKWFGVFRLMRYLTRNRLRILSYHGVALRDEARFRPGLFMEPTTIEQRMAFLARRGFPVLPLDQAVERLYQGTLPLCATVITIDDGFYGTYSKGLAIFQRYAFPATVYVTTYYAIKEQPIFRLGVQYLFWKTDWASIDLAGCGLPLSGQHALHDLQERDRVMWAIIQHGETACDETRRGEILRMLGERLGVDVQEIVESRILHIMNLEQIQAMASAGIDIQLHTHRHRLPVEEAETQREIQENRAILEPLTGQTLHHFCYPSGVWSEQHWPWLDALNIRSSTTCDPGLNSQKTPCQALSRFLDQENITLIEFEAEMVGFNELVRQIRSWVEHLIGKK